MEIILIVLLSMFACRVVNEPRIGPTRLAHGFRQRGEIVIFLVIEAEIFVFEQFPADRRPNRFGVLFTQIPHVWVGRGRQGA